MTIQFTNLKKFEADLEKFAIKTNIDIQTVLDKVTIDLFRDIIERTPVDTGYARANWNLNPTVPDTTINPAKAPKKGEKIDYNAINANQEKRISKAEKYYITNSLPYIIALEEGHSKQSGKGHMVKRSIAKAQQSITDLIRAIK